MKASTRVSAWVREILLIMVAAVAGGVKLFRLKDRVSSDPAGRLVAVHRRAVTPAGKLPIPLVQGIQVTVPAAVTNPVVEEALIARSVV